MSTVESSKNNPIIFRGRKIVTRPIDLENSLAKSFNLDVEEIGKFASENFKGSQHRKRSKCLYIEAIMASITLKFIASNEVWKVFQCKVRS
ncbi:MAG: hypothetical protein MHPSP_000066 [Paramarteilia canceri]